MTLGKLCINEKVPPHRGGEKRECEKPSLLFPLLNQMIKVNMFDVPHNGLWFLGVDSTQQRRRTVCAGLGT